MECAVTDDEIMDLASNMAPTYYQKLGVKLGIPIAKLDQILQTNLHNYHKCIVTILTTWRDQQCNDRSMRGKLAEALSKAGLKMLSETILKVPGPNMGPPPLTQVPAMEMPSPPSGLDESLLREIANNLETDDQMESLALALRIPRSEVNRCHAANRLTGSLTTRGTTEMLSNWRSSVSPDKQLSSLKSALTSARLLYLRDTVLKKAESQLQERQKEYERELQRYNQQQAQRRQQQEQQSQYQYQQQMQYQQPHHQQLPPQGQPQPHHLPQGQQQYSQQLPPHQPHSTPQGNPFQSASTTSYNMGPSQCQQPSQQFSSLRSHDPSMQPVFQPTTGPVGSGPQHYGQWRDPAPFVRQDSHPIPVSEHTSQAGRSPQGNPEHSVDAADAATGSVSSQFSTLSVGPPAPYQGSHTPSPLPTSPISPSQLASQLGQAIPNLSNIPPGASVTFMLGNFYATQPESSASVNAASLQRHPVIVPHEVRRELSVRLNAESALGNNWVGLAIKLDLDDYIEALKQSNNPTEEVIKIAEYQKEIKRLDDLVKVLRKMKRHDCMEVVESYLKNKQGASEPISPGSEG